MKHSWVAEIGRYHAVIRSDGEYVASIQANYDHPNQEVYLDEAGVARAHLIAAAPEMLEALRAAALHLMVRPQNRLIEADLNVADIINSAIKKAKVER